MQKYYSLLWIPCFPLRKVMATECAHCKQTLSGKELPAAYQAEISTQIPSARTPRYMFTGLVLVVLLVGLFIYIENINKQDTARYVTAPQVNDFYVVDAHEVLGMGQTKYKYEVLRVNSVQPDSIGFLAGNYQYQSEYGALKAIQDGDVKADDYFLKVEIPIEKTRIQAMLVKGYITSVTRNNK
ncbi:hypothetical protein HY009_07930 [Candidatus Acetothermia bacterium]|nr:hypothetical protein [Candidatus Acetothermia bacterium]